MLVKCKACGMSLECYKKRITEQESISSCCERTRDPQLKMNTEITIIQLTTLKGLHPNNMANLLTNNNIMRTTKLKWI